MCYYNGTKVTRSELLRLKNLERVIAKYQFFNNSLYVGTDYVQAPVMRRYPKKEDFELAMKDWGMLPPNIQSDKEVSEFRKNFIALNAKAENLFESESGGYSMFAEAALNRRCLVPSTHYFEMRHVFPRGRNGKVLKTPIKYPYMIYLDDPEISFFAGVWNPNEKRGSNFAIITYEATENLALIHNTKKRMPVRLTEDIAWEWLFGNLKKNDVEDIARYQYNESKVRWHTVERNLFTSLDPMKKVIYPELPPLGVDVMPYPQKDLFQ